MNKWKILTLIFVGVTVAVGSGPRAVSANFGAQVGPALWPTKTKFWFGCPEVSFDPGVYWHQPIKEKGWFELGVLGHVGGYSAVIGDSSLSFFPVGLLGSIRLGRGVGFGEFGFGGGMLTGLQLEGEDLMDVPTDTGSLFMHVGAGCRFTSQKQTNRFLEIGIRVPFYSTLYTFSPSFRIGLAFDFELDPKLKLDIVKVTGIGNTKLCTLYSGGEFSIEAAVRNEGNLVANKVTGKIELPEGVKLLNSSDAFDTFYLGKIRRDETVTKTLHVKIHPSLVDTNLQFTFDCNGKKPLFRTEFSQRPSDTRPVQCFEIDILKRENVTTRPNAIAFLFGVQDYQNPKHRDIKYTLRDVYAVRNYLINVSGFDCKNVFVIDNPNRNKLIEYFGGLSNPLSGKIYKKVAAKNDSVELFVYFAGHGAYLKTFDIDVGDSVDGTFLLPIDSITKLENLKDKTYPTENLFTNLLYVKNELNVAGVTLVIDACHADPTGREVLPGHLKWWIRGHSTSLDSKLADLTSDDAPKPTIEDEERVNTGIVAMLASSQESIAYEDDSTKHGYFTKWLIKRLYEADDSTSLWELKESINSGFLSEEGVNQETKFLIVTPTEIIGDTISESAILKRVTNFVR